MDPMAADYSSGSDWQKISSHHSSSASSSDNDDDGWFVVKNKQQPKASDDEDQNSPQKVDEDQNSLQNEDEEEEDVNDELCSVDDGNKSEGGEGQNQEKEKEDQNQEEQEEDGMCSVGDGDKSKGGEGSEEGETNVLIKELLFTYLPELAATFDRFSLEYIEQEVFPQLPTKFLLRLRHASARWARWISSPFFVHRHSLTCRALSGFFFHDTLGRPSFTSFDDGYPFSCTLPDPSLSFLPEPVLVKASTHGLLCCRGRETLDYYVCNPITAQWAALPPTADNHDPDTAVVIVMQEPLTFNFDDDYYLVCAYEIFDGVYGFETFSSEKWAWRKSNEIVAAELIVPGSGVAVAGAAYWRTTMQTVVGLDPAVDKLKEVQWADDAPAAVQAGEWEIGELGKKLCLVSVGRFRADVRVWEGGSRWKKVSETATSSYAKPLRAQGEREVTVWERKTVMVLDVERGTRRTLAADSNPGDCADFMPYVSSLVRVSGSKKLGSSSNMI